MLPEPEPFLSEPGEPEAYAAPTSEDRGLAVFCHVGGFFASFVVPLVIWLVKKGQSPFVEEHAKESLNFQIALFAVSLLIGCLSALGIVAGALTEDGGLWATSMFGGLAVSLALTLFDLIVIILASIAAYRGRPYRYPVNIRFFR
jgi:uncharacterized Tic20 family protein